MSSTTALIIVITLTVLIGIVAFAVHYFGILLAEDQAASEPLNEDAAEDDDIDEADLPEPNFYEADGPAYQKDVVEDEYLPPASPEFLARFAIAYIEEKTERENSRMRHLAPRLFSDHWYEDTRRAFSQWAVEMREVYQLAS